MSARLFQMYAFPPGETEHTKWPNNAFVKADSIVLCALADISAFMYYDFWPKFDKSRVFCYTMISNTLDWARVQDPDPRIWLRGIELLDSNTTDLEDIDALLDERCVLDIDTQVIPD